MVGRRANVALGLAWAVGFTMWGLLLAVSSLLPAIQEDLGLSFTVRSLVLALPLLSLSLIAAGTIYLTMVGQVGRKAAAKRAPKARSTAGETGKPARDPAAVKSP